MIHSVIRCVVAAALLAPVSASAQPGHVQFCWAIGKFDHTIYFAEVENREDRQASFDTLLEISGIDHHPVKCTVSEKTAHRVTRMEAMRDWLGSEFEIVNTTFLSDLDY